MNEGELPLSSFPGLSLEKPESINRRHISYETVMPLTGVHKHYGQQVIVNVIMPNTNHKVNTVLFCSFFYLYISLIGVLGCTQNRPTSLIRQRPVIFHSK